MKAIKENQIELQDWKIYLKRKIHWLEIKIIGNAEKMSVNWKQKDWKKEKPFILVIHKKMFIGKILRYLGFASKTTGLEEGSGGGFSGTEAGQDLLTVEDER